MWLQLGLLFLLLIFILLALLSVYNKDWLSKCAVYLLIVCALPLVIVGAVLKMLYHLFRAGGVILWAFVKALSKTAVFLLTVAPVTLIIGSSSFIPHFGRQIQRINQRAEDSISFSRLRDEAQFTRELLVEIITEVDEPEPEYDSKDEYRARFVEVKEQGKTWMAAGESVLSLFIGGILLISQVYGFSIFQANLYGVTVGLATQVALFIIAVSIMYRVSIMELLAYTGDEEFSSCAEMDVALTYQRAISRAGFMQYLMFLLVLAVRLSNADRQVIRDVLDAKYSGDSIWESMQLGWERLTDSNK